ncbi:hypothetical protein B0H11DRAFT_2059676 [Mycena galericulata]|nr:hypothetical protein B0H11DRAFT_2059676 [Mycena galericulata]
MTSYTETSTEDDLSFWNKASGNSQLLEFRVLIMGRANAGKTTILERLTGASMEEAEVRREGKILPHQIVRGQSDRGLHYVLDEICLPFRPGFVFHDSRGVEAGSAQELDTVQRFVEHHSSVTKVQEQLHAIWMCFPLDESRELSEGEKQVFGWSMGAAALVVIFTKRDGAVLKEASQIVNQILEGSPGTPISRAIRKDARQRAEIQVTNRVNALEQELRSLSTGNNAVGFLTTSGMEERTPDTDDACQHLIKLTENGLTKPRLKTLLSAVWGRNLSRRGFWFFYWVFKKNHVDMKLGSGRPSTHGMIEQIITHMDVSIAPFLSVLSILSQVNSLGWCV